MSELEALYGLLKRAYDAGFTRGNQFDSGCTPEGFGQFQEFWDRLGGGDITSALADMMDRAEPEQPDLQPGVQIPFRQGDYVVMQVHRDGSRTTVEMQDIASYRFEREFIVASAGCGECGYPAGLHNLACSQDNVGANFPGAQR